MIWIEFLIVLVIILEALSLLLCSSFGIGPGKSIGKNVFEVELIKTGGRKVNSLSMALIVHLRNGLRNVECF